MDRFHAHDAHVVMRSRWPGMHVPPSRRIRPRQPLGDPRCHHSRAVAASRATSDLNVGRGRSTPGHSFPSSSGTRWWMAADSPRPTDRRPDQHGAAGFAHAAPTRTRSSGGTQTPSSCHRDRGGLYNSSTDPVWFVIADRTSARFKSSTRHFAPSLRVASIRWNASPYRSA